MADERGQPPYRGQDFAEHDIYFVNARRAQQAKLRDDPALLERSGLPALERRLSEFLLSERHDAHPRKYVTAAGAAASSLEQTIAQRIALCNQKVEKLEQEYARVEPQLRAIRERDRALASLFARLERKAARELSASFELAIARLRVELPDELARTPLPSVQGMAGIASRLTRERTVKDAMEACNHFIATSLARWHREEAHAALTSAARELLDAVAAEIKDVARDFSRVHEQLSGLPAREVAGEVGEDRAQALLSDLVLNAPPTVQGTDVGGAVVAIAWLSGITGGIALLGLGPLALFKLGEMLVTGSEQNVKKVVAARAGARAGLRGAVPAPD